MIQLTDYLGEPLNVDETVIVTVSNYSQNGDAGSKIEYRINPTSISVLYVTEIPSVIAAATPYVAPVVLAFDNGQSETIYLNPSFYRSYIPFGSNTQLLYEYQIGAQAKAFTTSTSTGAIAAQIAAITPPIGSGTTYQVTLTNNGTDTYADADIDFSVPSGLTTLVGKNLLLAFITNTMENVAITSPALPAVIGASIVFTAPPSGDITLIVS